MKSYQSNYRKRETHAGETKEALVDVTDRRVVTSNALEAIAASASMIRFPGLPIPTQGQEAKLL